jgi:transcription elongation factor Elf1
MTNGDLLFRLPLRDRERRGQHKQPTRLISAFFTEPSCTAILTSPLLRRAQSTAVCGACQRVTCASVGRVLGRNAERTAAAPALSQLGWLSLRCGALSRSSSQISKHSRWNRVSCQSSASILTVMVSSGRIGVPHPSQVCLVPGPHDNSTEFSCGRRPSQRRRWMSCRISVASISLVGEYPHSGPVGIGA